MRVTVTGAAGRLGSEVVKHLHGLGHEISATDKGWRGDLPVKVQVADLLQITSLYNIMEGSQALIHLGNHASHWGRDGQRVYSENVTMNINAFQAAKEVGVKKILFASSVQCISGPWSWWSETKRDTQLPYLPLDGDVPPNPGNPYALSKQTGEVMLAYYVKQEGLTARAVRFPSLSTAEMRAHWDKRGYRGENLDEAFTFLSFEEAARLCGAFITAELTGFKIWFPASKNNRYNLPLRELIGDFYSKVPLKRPLESLDSLVDCSAIEADCGWKAP